MNVRRLEVPILLALTAMVFLGTGAAA